MRPAATAFIAQADFAAASRERRMTIQTTVQLPSSLTGGTDPGNTITTAAALSPWLAGNFAPIAMECDAPHLPVTGDLRANCAAHYSATVQTRNSRRSIR